MTKEMKKELRKLLTGHTYRNEDGLLVAIPQGNPLIYHGVSDNTGRKIISCSDAVEIPRDMDTEALFQKVLDSLQQMGLLANMETWPEALCVLKRYFFTKAVLLCVVPADSGTLKLEAYTGWSILAVLYCKLAIRKFKKTLLPKEQ